MLCHIYFSFFLNEIVIFIVLHSKYGLIRPLLTNIIHSFIFRANEESGLGRPDYGTQYWLGAR